MPLTPGTRIGAYEIRSLLGSGGMGEVYVARDTRLDRDVAFKLFPADLTVDAERLRRFEQEARSASALNHPAIVAVYELGGSDAQRYISMEFVQGETLRQLLARGPMPTRRALQIAAQIADGLAKAHDSGIVHRDLKPENLMVSRDGFAKILDFGLAKLISDDDTGAMQTITGKGTRPGTVMGTVGYMSPEQASGRETDSRTDQFSFGVVLYEMLTGSRAFHAPTPVETLTAIIREDPPAIAQRNAAVPPPVRWIVERCLAKAPEDRYGSTRDLARDLASARDHFSELSASGATAAVGVTRPRAATSRRERLAWSLAVLVAIAAGALVVRPFRTPPVPQVNAVRFTLAPPDGHTFYSNVGEAPFAISPDGRQLVFVLADTAQRRQLWLRSLDSFTTRPLPGTEGAVGPFWSPDGQYLGFFDGRRLKRISLASGDPVTICDARSGGGGAWNTNDVILFAPSVDSPIYRVAAAGGTPVPVTTLDTAHDEAAHLSPVFLADQRHFVFQVIGGDQAGIFVGAIDSPERKRILPLAAGSKLGFTAPNYLLFAQDRTLMAQRLDMASLHTTGDVMRIAEGVASLGPTTAFAVSETGVLAYWSGAENITQPTWLRRDGTSDGTVGEPATYINVAVSSDGRQIAVDRFDTDPAIWVIDVARGTRIRATAGAKYESTPVWAPDGRTIAFASARDTPPNIYVKRLGTAGPDERLTRSTLQSFPQSWSPDGRFIAYVTVNPKTQGDLWLVPTAGDRKPVPFLVTPFTETHARISPDGRWLAYVSNESGVTSVYVTRFPEAGYKWQVSGGGGSHPVWRRDGRELYYRAADGMLMATAVKTGAEFEPGTPTPLFKLDEAPGRVGLGTFYDITPDGRFLVNRVIDRRSPPANVVLNWPSAVGVRE